MSTQLRPAIFLDRDGVLNVDLGYTYKVSDLKLVSGTISGLKKLYRAGFDLVVITNQSGVARGFFTLEDVAVFHEELRRQIAAQAPEVRFLDFMICPHHPKGVIPEFAMECECRKPGTKLITDAAAKFKLDLAKSWLVGDKASDVDCAHNAGMRAIQVTQGGKQYDLHPNAFAKAPTLDEAADIIISNC